MRRPILAALLSFGLGGPAQAALDDAVTALERYDYALAYAEFLSLAERGDAIAQYYLAHMYYYGLGVPADYVRTYEWMRRSAEQRDPDAETFLGDLFYAGEGVPQNYARAVYWYRRAAEQGHPYARYSLAFMQFYGEGLPEDPQEAMAVLHQLAEEGFPYAQRSLGYIHEYGDGVPRNLERALEWYRRAAEQGDVYALGSLGRIYGDGVGVARDLPQAYAWWNLAAARAGPGPNRDFAVRQRDKIAGQLSTARLAEAQAMAAAWFSGSDEAVAQHSPDGRRSLARAAFSAAPQPPSEPELESSGTGFVVSRANHVLTSHHVVEGCAEIRVAPAGGVAARAEIVTVDPESDLALLRGPGHAADHARFRDGRGIRQGEGLVILGFPLRGILASGVNVSTGVVSAVAGMGDDRRLIQISSPVQAGNSGGPVLDMSGNAIGVVTSKLDAMEIEAAIGDLPQNVNFATSRGAVFDFLEESGVPIETTSSDRSMEVTEIVERARRFTVVVECWN